VQEAGDAGVGFEVVGHARERLEHVLREPRVDRRLDVGRAAFGAAPVPLPHPFERRVVELVVLVPGGAEFLLQQLTARLLDGVGLVAGDAAQGEQALEVPLAHRAALADALVHARLGERGLVALVVTPAAVAVHVDHHVALEGAAEVHGQLDDLRHRLGILAVDVEDGALQHLGDVAGVRRGPPLVGTGREPDLVVHDHVQRAADAVALELRHVQALLHHALADEARVAVDEDGQCRLAALVMHAVLLGADAAHRHRIDELQVGRVERQRHVDLVPVLRGPVVGVAEVVLDVAATAVQLGVGVLELAEDCARVLAHDVRQHVQAAAVRHADDHLAHALRARLLQREVEEWDQRLAALEREALGADVLLLDELLEHHRVGELGQDADLRLAGELDVVAGALHALLQPLAHLEVVDVHELRTDGPGVGLPQRLDDVTHGLGVGEGGLEHRPVHVGLGEAVVGRVDLGDLLGGGAERVEVGHAVGAHSEVAHQAVEALRQFGVGGGDVDTDRRSRRCRRGTGARRVEEAVGPERRAETATPRRAVRRHGVEVAPPLVADRVGVLEVREVDVLDEGEAGAVQARVGFRHA
jgi:hypothetical protein